jgi:hypothetical protein
VSFNDGLPATAKWVRESILSKVEGVKQKAAVQKAESSKRNTNGKKAAVKKAVQAAKNSTVKKVSVAKKGAR